MSRVVKKGVSQGGTNSSKSVMRLGLLGTPNMNISNPLSLFFYRGHPTYVEEKILIIFTLKYLMLLLELRPTRCCFTEPGILTGRAAQKHDNEKIGV